MCLELVADVWAMPVQARLAIAGDVYPFCIGLLSKDADFVWEGLRGACEWKELGGYTINVDVIDGADIIGFGK